VHPHRRKHQGHLPGLHGQERDLSFRAGDRLWHPHGRGHLAGQGRGDASRPAGVRHRHGGEGEDRGGRERHLCAAGRRRRRHPRGDRRRDPAHRLHHRGHSGAGHGAGEARALRVQEPADRAELPGRADAGRVQDRHHARQHLQEGLRRRRQPLRHAHLRGGVPDHQRGPR
ncbi:MAG: Succinyl-CoA ligase [ADP-forming] alpha chain, partial [uncultured Microvirga sp.]